MALFALLGLPGKEHPRLTSSQLGNVVYQAPWKLHCTSFGDSLDSKNGGDVSMCQRLEFRSGNASSLQLSFEVGR